MNPQVWFAQVGDIFDLHHATSEASRFHHLLRDLSPEVAQEVADVITAHMGDAPYRRLKQVFWTAQWRQRARASSTCSPSKSLEIAAPS